VPSASYPWNFPFSVGDYERAAVKLHKGKFGSVPNLCYTVVALNTAVV